MSSNNPVSSKKDPLSFNWTERQKPSRSRCKLIGGRILICLGVLWALGVIAVKLYSAIFNPDVIRTQLTDDYYQLKLKPEFGENYAKFTYDIISDTYSLNNRSGLQLNPYVVTRIERVVDRTSNVAYLHNQRPYHVEYLQWYFDFSSPGKSVEKLKIKMKEIQSITTKEGGEVRACLYLFDECTHFPANGSLTLENPSTDALHITVMIHDNNTIFNTSLDNESSVESLSIEIYWKDRYPNDISSTSFTSRWWTFNLEPYDGEDYAEFAYVIVNNTLSNNYMHGLPGQPQSFENVERVVDRASNVTYVHKKRKDAPGWIQWVFYLKFFGKSVDAIDIKLKGMDEMADSGGKVQACFSWTRCYDIPVDGYYFLNKYQLDYFTIKIVLDDDIKVLKTSLTDQSEDKSFSVDVFWVSRNHSEITTTSFTSQRKPIKLNPKSEENYVKFTYDIMNNTYSHNHEDGSLIEPYFVQNIERVVDVRWFDSTYLRKEGQFGDMGSIKWEFDLKANGKAIEKIEIKMSGLARLTDGDGIAKACLASKIHDNCFNITTDGRLMLEKPQFDYLVLIIELDKDVEGLVSELEVGSSVESFSVEVYWSEKRH